MQIISPYILQSHPDDFDTTVLALGLVLFGQWTVLINLLFCHLDQPQHLLFHAVPLFFIFLEDVEWLFLFVQSLSADLQFILYAFHQLNVLTNRRFEVVDLQILCRQEFFKLFVSWIDFGWLFEDVFDASINKVHLLLNSNNLLALAFILAYDFAEPVQLLFMPKMRLVDHSQVLITPLIVLLHHLLNFAVIASMKILDLLLELVDSPH